MKFCKMCMIYIKVFMFKVNHQYCQTVDINKHSTSNTRIPKY